MCSVTVWLDDHRRACVRMRKGTNSSSFQHSHGSLTVPWATFTGRVHRVAGAREAGCPLDDMEWGDVAFCLRVIIAHELLES